MRRAILALAVVLCAGCFLISGCGFFGNAQVQYVGEKKVVCPYCGSDQVRRKTWSPLTGMIGASIRKEYKCPACNKEFAY